MSNQWPTDPRFQGYGIPPSQVFGPLSNPRPKGVPPWAAALAAGVVTVAAVLGGLVCLWGLGKSDDDANAPSSAATAVMADRVGLSQPAAEAQTGAEIPSATGSVSSNAAYSSNAPTTVATSGPPPAGTAGLIASSAPTAAAGQSPGLQYAWQNGQTYECTFSVDASLENEKIGVHGVVSYVPTEYVPTRERREPAEEEGSGTGFFVTPDGVMVTCAHVIRGAKSIVAHLGGRAYPAQVMAFDSQTDLALLKVDATGLPCLRVADSGQVQQGQDIRVVGFPLSDVLGESVKITRGTVAGIVEKREERLFQIDASINPGNSGGPLVDTRGRVVGVANALLTGESIDRVGFAIPSTAVLALLRKHRVDLPAMADPAGDLSGPDLANRTTPSVPLLKVKIGPGGYGVAKQTSLSFVGTYSLRGPSGLTTLGTTDSAHGTLVVDAGGKVDQSQGDAGLPLWLGSIGQMGIELLPESGERQWRTSRLVPFERRVSNPRQGNYGMYSPYGPRRIGPPRLPGMPGMPSSPFSAMPPGMPRPPFPYGKMRPSDDPFAEPEREEKAVAFLAHEVVRYRCDDPAPDGTIVIHKEYELTALARKGEVPPFEVKGTGTVTWDAKQGIPKKAELTYSRSVRTTNLTITIPCAMNYQFGLGTARGPVARGRSGAAPSAGPDGTPVAATKQPPVRKIDAPAADTPPPPVMGGSMGSGAGALGGAPSGSGLNMLEDDSSGAQPGGGSSSVEPAKPRTSIPSSPRRPTRTPRTPRSPSAGAGGSSGGGFQLEE